MGTSEAEDGGGIGVDCTVGTIVWVRRRNGSWWPGRILGPEELSASHLMSPRSGTPVKLLGREDASVDWYNLEKSKRVKAFRCGEFDACIERAEASQGTPSKKREKYARREDAILHALELEKQQRELKQQKVGAESNVISNKKIGAHEYISHEEENLYDSVFINKARGYKDTRWEEDGPEVVPRMRGLRDFGLRTAQSKSKLSQSLDWQNAVKPLDVEVLSTSGMEDASHATSNKNSRAARKKRSQSGVAEDSQLKKRDRRRPLVQVMQSSEKLPPHSFHTGCNISASSIADDKGGIRSMCRVKQSRYAGLLDDLDGLSENGGHNFDNLLVCSSEFGTSNELNDPFSETGQYTCSGSIEANHFASSEPDYVEPDIKEMRSILTADALVPGPKFCEPPGLQAPDQFRRPSENKTPLSGTPARLHEQIADVSSEVGVAKWHMKGKRNVRTTGKRHCAAVEKCNGFVNEAVRESKGANLNCGKSEIFNQRVPAWGIHPKKEPEPPYTCEEGDLIDEDFAQAQLHVYDDWADLPLPFPRDGPKSHDDPGGGPSRWQPDRASGPAAGAFWDDPSEPPRPVRTGDDAEAPLIDVDLRVEAGYQGERVPLVSLMSRWNRKAVIGHPIQVEMLESGSSSRLLDLADDGPAWRTARRTAMQRVPRPNPSAARPEDDHKDACASHARGSRPGKPKKNTRRLSSSTKKTRMLSSLASNDKPGGRSGGINFDCAKDILGGLIKPEGSMPPVTCVPAKVVFSRLLEALGRPSSATAYRVRTSSPAFRDPS